MKFYSLVFSIFILIGCGKEEIDPVKFGRWGSAKALLTGNLVTDPPDWNALTATFPSDFCENCFTILFGSQDDRTLISKSLLFDHIPAKVGKYQSKIEILQEKQEGSTDYDIGTFDGEDLIVHGRYTIFEENEENFIEITSVEEKRSELRIKGRFQGVYVRTNFWLVDTIPPDTIFIQGGEFEGRIPK